MYPEFILYIRWPIIQEFEKKIEHLQWLIMINSLEFSLNAFKKNKNKKEDCRVGTQDLLYKRQRLYHCTTKPQATEQILMLNPIHAWVISQIIWIPLIQWKFCSI